MPLRYVKRGFNYSQDGPGNRLVYHLAGCNLRCPWCANPEAMSPADPASEIGIEELAEEAAGARAVMFEGGGITFTGGEPTMQFSALREALAALKDRGIDTCMESNATHPQLAALFPLLDHIILDFKHYDSGKHLRFTGISNEGIRENLARAAASGKDVLIRTPLIGGVNASREDAEGFLNFYRTVDSAHLRFELLRYHEYGKPKWEKLGFPYGMGEDARIGEDIVLYFEEKYRENGLTVVRT